MLQIAENAARGQGSVYLGIKRSLSLISAMVNSKTRYDDFEAAKIGQGILQVVLNNPNLVIAAKSRARRSKHRGRKVERNTFCVTPLNAQQRQQTTVSSSQIKNSPDLLWHELQQNCLAFRAMRNAIRASQILQRVLGCCVFIEARRARHTCARSGLTTQAQRRRPRDAARATASGRAQAPRRRPRANASRPRVVRPYEIRPTL